MTVAVKRNIFIADLLYDGVENILDETVTRIKDACIAYSKLLHPSDYNVSRSVTFVNLWVKYNNRTVEAI